MSVQIKLGDILTSQVITLPPECSIRTALDTMRQKHISAIVVLEHGKPVGIFTERDAVMMVFHHVDVDEKCLSDVMSTQLVTAPVTMEYREAYRLVKQHHLRHLIVIDAANNLLGIISESNFLDHLGNEFIVRFKEVGSLMTDNVITLPLEALVKDAIQLMAHDHISCIVIESNGTAKGIFTERDLVNLDTESGDVLEKPIQQIMSTPVICVHQSDTLPLAIDRMEKSNIRHLVVVDNKDDIIGLVTRSDLVNQLYDQHIDQLKNIIRDREAELDDARQKLHIMNELYQTQHKLQEKQIKLQLALDAGKICTWDFDAQNYLVITDARMAELFSVDQALAEKGIALKFLLELVSPDDHQLIYNAINHTISTGDNLSVEFRILRDTETSYFKALGEAKRNKKNEITGIVGVLADITSDRKNLLSFKRSQKQLIEAQHIARMGTWELNAKTLRAIWSQEIHQLLGTNADMDIGLEILQSYVHEEDWPRVKKSLLGAISENLNHEIEYRISARDGSIHWVYCKAKNKTDKSGKVTRLKGILQDITERKRWDEQLRLSSTVFNNSLEGILVTDVNGKIVDVNPAFSDITGYSRHEIIGLSTNIFKSGHHDDDFYNQMWQSLHDTGQWRGEIWNRRKNGSVYPEWENISSVYDEQGNKTHYVSVFSDISQIKSSQIKLDHLAHHDALTDLPNRLLLNERLNQAIKHAHRVSSKLAVFFLDLDNFKHINDSLGHPTGDHLLKTVTRKLLNTVRQDDTVARIGGDEFVILLEDLDRPEDAVLMADKLLAIFQQSFELEDHQIGITASLGICLFPEDGQDAETLLRNADSAMYLAKNEGRNTYQFYTAELTRNAFERVLLENSLRKAIEKQEFKLYYQPQFNLGNLELIGFEALIRWQHPDLGVVSPVKFIPIAEDSGLIIPIGKWVLNEACRQAKQWLENGLTFGKIAVNISGPQLHRGNLIDDVKNALEQSGLPATYLEIEITESFIMQQAKEAIQQLNILKDMGITISIDDFGTGYSSLSYLKQLPIQKLKIDQSFVRDIPHDSNDMAIANAIIAMGKSLDLTVIAEGVETIQQAEFLQNFGCQEVQGFLYSWPLTSSVITEKLRLSQPLFTNTET